MGVGDYFNLNVYLNEVVDFTGKDGLSSVDLATATRTCWTRTISR